MAIDAVSTNVALEVLRDCLEEGKVTPGKHFLEELEKEDLTLIDAWHVLRTGCIYKPPELDIRSGEWKYIIEGNVPDGTRLAIVFCLKEVNHTYLITCFSLVGR
jgi:hypothetical protein